MNRNIPFSHVHSNIFFFFLPVKNAQPGALSGGCGSGEKEWKEKETAAIGGFERRFYMKKIDRNQSAE